MVEGTGWFATCFQQEVSRGDGQGQQPGRMGWLRGMTARLGGWWVVVVLPWCLGAWSGFGRFQVWTYRLQFREVLSCLWWQCTMCAGLVKRWAKRGFG